MEQKVLTSGLLWLSHDEIIVLQGLRAVKGQQRGEMYVKIDQGNYSVFSVKPDFGSVQAVNHALRKEPMD